MPVLDFQSSLQPFVNSQNESYMSINLFPNGCLVGRGTSNCTLACQDPTYLFNSTYNVANCLTLATVAVAAPADAMITIEDGSPSALSFFEDKHVAQVYADSVLNNLITCTSAVCNGSSGAGSCSSSLKNNLSQWDATKGTANGNLSQIIDILNGGSDYMANNFCGGVETTVNGDIAGPGVLIAYGIQTIILDLIWMITSFSQFALYLMQLDKKWLDTWIVDPCLHLTWRLKHWTLLSRKAHPFDRVATRNSTVHELTESRLVTSVNSALVDFQEAQIFFALSIQVAVFFSLRQDKALGGEETFASVLLDRYLNELSTSLLFYSVSCGQIILESTWTNSWYILTLYLSVLSISWSFWFSIPPIGTFGDYPQLVGNSDLRLTACGNNISPKVFCAGDSFWTPGEGVFMIDSGTSTVGIIMSFLVLPLMILRRLRHWQIYSQQAQGAHIPANNLNGRPWVLAIIPRIRQGLIHPITCRLVHWTVDIMYAVVSGNLILGITFETLVIINITWSTKSSSNWSLGQIIALTVWAPVICKFVYLLLFGIEESSPVRGVPEPYKIVNTKRLSASPPDSGMARLSPGGDQATVRRSTFPGVSDDDEDLLVPLRRRNRTS